MKAKTVERTIITALAVALGYSIIRIAMVLV